MYSLTINQKSFSKRYPHIEKMIPHVRKIMGKITQSISFSTHSSNKTLSHIDQKEIMELVSSRFVEEHIKKDILKNYKRVSVYTFEYKTNTISLKINHRGEVEHMDIYILMVKIFTLLELVKKKKKHITLTLILTSHLKKLDTYSGFIGNNVNSGATYFRSGKSTKIVVFRQEEFMKVTLHELIHFLQLDFASSGEIVANTVLGTFAINKNYEHININEGYTECMALVYNSIFNSVLTKTNINLILHCELEHSRKMATRILGYFGMEHIIASLNVSSNNILIQRSNILAYFFIKFACLLDLETFMKTYPLGIKWRKKNIKQFLSDTVKILRTEAFYPDNKYNLKNKSARMTQVSLIKLDHK